MRSPEVPRGTGLTLCLLLSACLPDWETYNARSALLTDADEDGYSPLDGDCDDADPLRAPGLPERCDGLDDDCDGVVDEDPVGEHTLWYLDGDHDGWGANSEPVQTCGRPAEGYTERDGDCDDSDPDVRPDMGEYCDGVDNDCDQENYESPTNGTHTWHRDADEDGFGSDDDTVLLCEAPGGYVAEGGDCDDDDPEAWPGAPELCDGIDNDCDTAVDDPPLSGEGAWFPDADHDGYGDERSSETRCSAAAGFTTVGGDCDDSDDTVNPDEAEVCNDGADNDCDGTPNDCAWPTEVDMTDHLKVSGSYRYAGMGWAGGTADLDGDGADELVLTEYNAYDTSTGTYPGKVGGFTLPLTPGADLNDAEFVFKGDGDIDSTGFGFSTRDLDGDGYDDLVIGAMQFFSSAASNPGRVYVTYGPHPTSGALASFAGWTITGRENDDWFGTRIETSTDLSGDGRPDFIVAQEEDSYITDYSGSVYLFRGEGSGSGTATGSSFATLYGSNLEEYFGSDTAALDFDGDGLEDLVVSAEGGGTGGTVHLFTGPVTGSRSSDSADGLWYSEASTSLVGDFLSAAKDANGDGYADLLVSGSQSYSYGAAFLLWGGPTLTEGPIYDAQVKFRKDAAGCCFGHLVEVVGDVNDDGAEDILIGERGFAPDSLYLYYGPFDTAGVFAETAADVTLTGDSTSDTGYTLALNPGDVNGDGVTDLLIGSYQHDPGAPASDSGAAYLIAGLGL